MAGLLLLRPRAGVSAAGPLAGHPVSADGMGTAAADPVWGAPSPMARWPCTRRKRLGRPGMPTQAVGGAVARNPLSVLVPCHRVVGRTAA